MASSSTSPTMGQQPGSAPPPSKLEIERKLSFRSAAAPSRTQDSPRKPRKAPPAGPPSAYHSAANAMSGNESDTSSVTSSVPPNFTSPTYPASPVLTPATPSVGGLSAIAERKGSGTGSGGEFDEEMELEDVEEGDEEASGSEDDVAEGEGELQRGMEGERMVKSGYLYKKQERRKAWKKKWFVLRTGKLAYYKDDREYSLRRAIDLNAVHTCAPVTVKKHPFTFGIVTSKRTFLVKANSQDEMDEWVRAINSVRRKMSEQKEEERTKRDHQRGGVSIPARPAQDGVDTHQGTWQSSVSGSVFASSPPTSSQGYFTSRQPTQPLQQQMSGLALGPPSPEATRSISSQLASLGVGPSSPAQMVSSRVPSTGFPTSVQQSRSVSAVSSRREPSAGSASSTADYARSPPQAGALAVPPPGAPVSSDEEDGEPYFSDPSAAFQPMQGPSTSGGQPPLFSAQAVLAGPVDSNKIILSGYLMKRSKGRGRKLWKKRWFFLTSQGLTYTKSHMDNRALRYIPLTSVLDALESASSPDGSSTDTDSDHSPPARQNTFSVGNVSVPGTRSRPIPREKRLEADEHIFRIVTAKRTFVLCAPSEEDEIKWLAAFRALLNREREKTGGQGPTSPVLGNDHRPSLPLITAQPPTPAGQTTAVPEIAGLPTSHGPPVPDRDTQPSSPTSAGPPVLPDPTPQPGTLGMRGRSATYTAKSAVAEVVRRFRDQGGVGHPPSHQPPPPLPPQIQSQPSGQPT